MNNIININSLLNLTAGLYSSEDEGFILSSTLLSLMGKLKIVRAVVYHPIDKIKFKPSIIKGNIPAEDIDYFEINHFNIVDTDDDFNNLKRIGIEYLIPVKDDEQFYALICLGKSLSQLELTDEEHDYINLISKISANAIRNAKTVVSYKQAKIKVEQRNQLLSTLFEISKDFSQNFSAERIIKMLALNLMGQLTVSRFAVFTISDEGEILCIVNRFSEKLDNDFLRKISDTVFAQEINKLSNYDDISSIAERLKIQAVAPMTVQGTTRGLLVIGRKMNGTELTDENLLFIEAIGNSAIAALENERLFKEELEKKRIESELDIALEIQNNLLPDKSPEMRKFDIDGISIPSRHVGGDLYDFIRLDDNRCLIAIADVSGKGIPASLIMANFQAALRVLALSGLPLGDIVLKINNLLYHNTGADKFVTAFFCIVDDEKQTISYINAGHNPPFVKRTNGDIEQLKEGGLILGFMEEPFEYHSAEIPFFADDTVILYTDGVTEAENINKVDYGEIRLAEFMLEQTSLVPTIVMNNLIDDVRSHLGECHPNDDITLVVITGKSV